MNTIATTGSQALTVTQPSPQLRVKVDLLQALEAKQALGALYHPDMQLVYDEKSCGFTVAAFSHSGTLLLKSLEASILLDHAPLHCGQFCTNNTFEVRKNGELMGMATVVEVLDTGFQYWDWKALPQDSQPYADPFSMDQLECFLLHLEFDLLELPFLSDYSIRKSRTDDYAIDIRIVTPTGAVNHKQALKIINTLKNQPGEYCCLKPGFYQLSNGRQLENFECHFIFGSDSKSVTGRLIVL